MTRLRPSLWLGLMPSSNSFEPRGNMTKRQFALFAAISLVLTACAGMTAAEVGTIGSATVGAIAGISQALNPYLPPEAQVKVAQALASAQNVWDAIMAGVTAVAKQAADAKAQAAITAQSQFSTTELTTGGALIAAATAKVAQVMTNRQRDQKYKHQQEA